MKKRNKFVVTFKILTISSITLSCIGIVCFFGICSLDFNKILFIFTSLFLLLSGSFMYFFSKEKIFFFKKNNNKTPQSEIEIHDDLFHSTPELIIILNTNNKIIEVNQTVLDQLKYTKHELLEKEITFIKPKNIRFEESECFSQPQKDIYKTCLSEFVTKQGISIFIEALIFNGLWNKQPVIYIVARNVGENENIQNGLLRFRTAVEQSHSSILFTDLNGNIEYVNPRFIELTGYSYSQVIGANSRIFKTAKHPETFYKQLWQTILSGKIWTGEFLNRKASDETFWESAVITPIKNENDQITHFLAIKDDITERKIDEFRIKRMNDDLRQAEMELRAAHEQLKAGNEALAMSYDELEKAKKRAEESDKLKSAFLANMSHEIRTPLNGIIGFSDLLIRENLTPEKKQKYFSVITSCSSQLLKIITDIIEISKIESAQLAIETDVFNFNQMLDQIYENISNHEFLKNKPAIRLLAEKTLSDKSMQLISDKKRLIQVFENLIQNAIKFSYKGDIIFGYKLKDTYLECYVKDNGIGISVEDQKVIFERFRQVHGTLNREFGGAGIGLSISQGIIELLDGKIWVESQLDVGSTFYFTIPYYIEL